MAEHDAPPAAPAATLAAAKAAALRELQSQPARSSDSPISTPSSQKPRAKPRRRRRAHRLVQHPQHTPTETPPASAHVDYVPEPIHALAPGHVTDPRHAAAVEQIVAAVARFAEMGLPPVDHLAAPDDTLDLPTLTPRDEHHASGDAPQPKLAKHAHLSPALDPHPDQPLSRKRLKEYRRTLIARLKEICHKPEVVESWDINSPDPVLLVYLKSYPNSVPVPVNWSQKRRYLQNKRGIEKRAFRLPAYIIDTGVGALRDAQIEAEDKKTLKQRQREKMRAKTGKGVEIDTQRLHDAFFKFQTKPRLTNFGDIYYELKELETDGSQFTPGVLSEELRAALGITTRDPPPWLINMQRYGPPPSYPGLTVPGVNAPIPAGASFGYHAGGWGKPPVDASGRPIYGDVFEEGLAYGGEDSVFETSQWTKDFLWGEMEAETTRPTIPEQTEEEEEERDDDEHERKIVRTGWTPTQAQQRSEAGRSDGKTEREERGGAEEQQRRDVNGNKLFTVLEQRRVSVGDNGIMGGSHVYEIRNEGEAIDDSEKVDDVQARRAQQQRGERQKRERGDGAAPSAGASKRQKEFKF